MSSLEPSPDLAAIYSLYDAVRQHPQAVETRRSLVQKLSEAGWREAAHDQAVELVRLSPSDSSIQALLLPLHSEGQPNPALPSGVPSVSTENLAAALTGLSVGYNVLRARAAALQLQTELLNNAQQHQRISSGTPSSSSVQATNACIFDKQASLLKPLAAGSFSSVLNGEGQHIKLRPPSSVRSLARAMESDRSRAMDIATEDLISMVRWLQDPRNPSSAEPDNDSLREAVARRVQALLAALPNTMQSHAQMAQMHVEHEALNRSYVCDETMYGSPIAEVSRSHFWVSEDGYAWDMEELAAAITSGNGVMRNPLSKQLFTAADIRAIVQHPLGSHLAALQIEQGKLLRGVRPTTVDHLEKLATALDDDMSLDQLPSRQAVDEFLAYVATLPEEEQNAVDSLRVPATDSHTGQPFDGSIGDSVRDALGNRTCFHKTGDFLRQAARLELMSPAVLDRLRRRKSETWHEDVERVAARASPVTSSMTINERLPWTVLQEVTNFYIRKKGNPPQPVRDQHLNALILSHPDKLLALAACAHALSHGAVRKLFAGPFKVTPGSLYELPSYLRAITVVRRTNPYAIEQYEADGAQTLVTFVNGVSRVGGWRELQTLLAMLAKGTQTDLLYLHIYPIAETFCRGFLSKLEELRRSGTWIDIYNATLWLTAFHSASVSDQTRPHEQLLQAIMTDWRAWAAWQPDAGRLRRWDMLDAESKRELSSIFPLEGPDFSADPRATWWQGLSMRGPGQQSQVFAVGSVQLELIRNSRGELQHMLISLLIIVDSLCRMGATEMAIFRHFCLGRPITRTALRTVETVLNISEGEVREAVWSLLSATEQSRSVRSRLIVHLLSNVFTPRFLALRDLLGPHLGDLISTTVREVQQALGQEVYHQGSWSLESELWDIYTALALATWLHVQIEQRTRTLLINLPERELLSHIHALHRAAGESTLEEATPLQDAIKAYYCSVLVNPESIDGPTKTFVGHLLHAWRSTTDPQRRALILSLGHRSGDVIPLPQCLREIASLPDELLRQPVLAPSDYYGDEDSACIILVLLLANTPLVEETRSWHRILLKRVHLTVEQRGEQLLRRALLDLSVRQWLQWVRYVYRLHNNPQVPSPQSDSPLRNPLLCSWTDQLLPFSSILTAIEDLPESSSAVQYILSGAFGTFPQFILRILSLLNEDTKWVAHSIGSVIICCLALDGANVDKVFEALALLRRTLGDGMIGCSYVVALSRGTQTASTEALLASLLHHSDLPDSDIHSITVLAELLDVEIPPLLDSHLDAAKLHIDNQIEELLQGARLLDNLRLAINSIDEVAVAALLRHNGIEHPSALQDALASIPVDLLSVIERVGVREVEMQFPLTRLRPIQKLALGLGTAQNLLLRFVVPDEDLPACFCFHLDTEPLAVFDAMGHAPWLVFTSRLPDIPTCHGVANRTTYQLARILVRHLHSGFDSLEKVYALVNDAIATLSRHCLVCGLDQGARLHRSMHCGTRACKKSFEKTRLEVRLLDIIQDSDVVDLLLAAVHATAVAGNPTLLPGCPIGDTTRLLAALGQIPSLGSLKGVEGLQAVIEGLASPARDVLTWACTQYRGFLASIASTGSQQIPNMPGIHQFVLPSAAPTLEATFQGQAAGGETRILFHGTSMSRLFAILSEGLKVLSGTPLQIHGASYGNGIYLTENLSTAWSYMAPAAQSWPNGRFGNVRVFLGCEVAGNLNPVSTGLYVAPSANTVIVRFIFLVPPSVRAPVDRHVIPAMQSILRGLTAPG